MPRYPLTSDFVFFGPHGPFLYRLVHEEISRTDGIVDHVLLTLPPLLINVDGNDYVYRKLGTTRVGGRPLTFSCYVQRADIDPDLKGDYTSAGAILHHIRTCSEAKLRT